MISQRIGTIIGILLFLSGNFVFAEEKKAPIIAVFDIDDQGAGIKKRIHKKLNEYLDYKLTE